MTLQDFKALLNSQGEKHFRLQLPGGSAVPVSFHVTEVGRVQKTFIDCGGVLREQVACQLQVWVGEDVDHRIEARKAAAILEKAKVFLTDETVPVEIEYEDEVISQYTIETHASDAEAVTLILAHKHTDCLAKELCGLPAAAPATKVGAGTKTGAATASKTPSCCGPSCC